MDWDLLSKVFEALRDNARNMVKSFEEGKIDSFGCLIHSIQLVIEEMILKLKSVKSIIEKCRKLASASNQGMKFNQELKRQQALQCQLRIFYFLIKVICQL